MIAGMSGKLPESENLEEFWANLIGGVDMVTDDDRRWKAGKPAWGSPPTWEVLFSFLTATVDTVSRGYQGRPVLACTPVPLAEPTVT